MTSTMTGFEFIQERSEATPGLWNRIFSTLSDNIGVAAFGPVDQFTIGDITSRVTTEILTVATSSATNDYIAFVDSSNAKSDYLIGSRVGGTADGLNLYDLSGDTMIVSFSKQSIRFFQNVTGPVFDTGGAYFNVKASGAIGNGIADDWAAIQSAFDAARLAGGGPVFFPAGS